MIGTPFKSEIEELKSEIKLMDAACIDYKETGYFSQTVIDYLQDKPELRPFYGRRPDWDGFKALLGRKKVIADRELLAEVLTRQYQPIRQLAEQDLKQVQNNIELVRLPDTYTITTGHQLNIFAGPLYFIYKIVTAIKLAGSLKGSSPTKILFRCTGWPPKIMILLRSIIPI